MIKVSIIGSGNVAQHLIAAFEESDDIEIVQVFARDKNSVGTLIEKERIVSDFNLLEDADLYILAISDKAIASVSKHLSFKNKLVAHTSGSIAINDLDAKNRKAVFYPLQTFSKHKAIDFNGIPICLESENAEDFQLLERVAKTIKGKVFAINSEQRKAVHVSAVFVNNFVNHMYEIGNDICDEYQIPFEILKPLIRETAEKVMVLSPSEAQTGPAKRKDATTIEAHLKMLQNPVQHQLYQLLTQSIQAHE